jgi:hypothetical protein
MITSSQRQTYLELFYSNCLAITRSKGTDYDPDGIPLMDVLAHAVDTNTEVRQVLWIYYGKHASAIRRYIQTGTVESEPLPGRLMDAANYLALISFYDTYKTDLHAAWRQHWLRQICACDDGPVDPLTQAVARCNRCETLSYLERRAFGVGSGAI